MTTYERVKAYHNADGLNQSALKLIAESPLLFKKVIDKEEKEIGSEKIHLRKGSAIDCLITSPEAFKEEFFVYPLEYPTGLLGKFFGLYLAHRMANVDKEEALEIAYQKSGYKQPKHTVVRKFLENEIYQQFIELRIENKNKTFLTTTEYEEVLTTVESLKTSKYTKGLFASNKDIELIFQHPLFFNITLEDEEKVSHEIPCKGLMDLIQINHKEKTIRGWDLKSTGFPIDYFQHSVKKFKYYIQAGFYMIGLVEWAAKAYPEYTVDPDFYFVVTETKEPFQSRVFKFSDIAAALYGSVDRHTGEAIEGVYQLLKRMLWHFKTNQWEYPKEVYENEGITTLSI